MAKGRHTKILLAIIGEHHSQIDLDIAKNEATITSRWKPIASLDRADGYTTPRFTEHAKSCGINIEEITQKFKEKLDSFRR